MNKIKEILAKISEYLRNKQPIIQHYLISSLITFVTGFLGSLLFLIDKFDLKSFETGAWIGLVGVALRAGFKALIEAWLKNKLKKQSV